jgi:hypothetical protein
MGRTHVVRATVLARGAVFLAAVLAAAGLVTIVSAHGGDTSLIHSCVTTAPGGGSSSANSGTIRIVGATETCRNGETPLDWSQNGQGDITAVIAGTGLTGGGSSGAVTLAVAVPLVLSAPHTNEAIVSATNTGAGPGLFAEGNNAGVLGNAVLPPPNLSAFPFAVNVGVSGTADGDRGSGVIGSSNGAGVSGIGFTGPGVIARNPSAAGNAVGLCAMLNGGTSSPCFSPGGNFAGVFDGNVLVNGTVNSSSDRAAKANIAAVDPRQVLERLVAIPIESWSYLSDDASIRHIGPMAQDFAAAFGVGQDDKHIATVDADGVALVAIQGLHQVIQEKDARLAALERQNAALEARLAAIEQRLAATPGN